MKTNSIPIYLKADPVMEEEIRDYAYHLYLQSGCIPGRDLDNWLEAKACLSACIPKFTPHTPRRQRSKQKPSDVYKESEVAVGMT